MQVLPENKSKIHEKSSCLSQRELLNYATGKLSEKEKKKAEMHLIECETCIALYQEVLNKKETADRNNKYSDLFPDSDKKSFSINFINKKQIFIGIALLLSVAVIFKVFLKFSKHSVNNEHAYSPLSEAQKTNGETVSDEEPASSPPVNEEKKIESLPVENKKSGIAVTEKKILNESKTIEKKPEEIKASETKPAISEPKMPVEKISSPPANTASKNPVPPNDSEEKIPSPPVAFFIKNYKISKSPGEPADGNYIKELEFIFGKIDQSQYKDAFAEVGKFSYDYPNDINAKYYRGYICYMMQDNETALTEMNAILSRHDKIFFEDARWYKALILNRTQKPDEGKKILNEIISQNGLYSSKAKELLELMGEK